MLYDCLGRIQHPLDNECLQLLATIGALKAAYFTLPFPPVKTLRDEGLVWFQPDYQQTRVKARLSEEGKKLLGLFTPQELARALLGFDLSGAVFYIGEIKVVGQLVEFLVYKDSLVRAAASRRLDELKGKRPVINLPRPLKAASFINYNRCIHLGKVVGSLVANHWNPPQDT